MTLQHLKIAMVLVLGMLIGMLTTHWSWLEHTKSIRTLTATQVAAIVYCYDELDLDSIDSL